MKLAYGTYATPTIPLEEVIPLLAGMGYEGIEICVNAPKHIAAMLTDFPAQRRAALRELLRANHLGTPALFMLGALFAGDEAGHAATRETLKQGAQLARDLGLGDTPVLAMGFGGGKGQWPAIKDAMVEQLQDYGALAAAEGFMLAAEAHSMAAIHTSDSIIELLEAVGSPNVRLHFDIVHLVNAGEAIEECVPRLVPWTAHTHITDLIHLPDGKFKFVLVGNGILDATAYLRAMHDAGWDDFITLEVSTMIWAEEGYDPVAAAQYCQDYLSARLAEAGVPRG